MTDWTWLLLGQVVGYSLLGAHKVYRSWRPVSVSPTEEPE